MNSKRCLLVVLGFVVALGACQTVKHVDSVEHVKQKSSLAPDKCYVGGTYLPSAYPATHSASLYLRSADGGIVALRLPLAGLFLAEVPAGQYEVDHLSFRTVDGKLMRLVVSELSGAPFETVPGQVTNVGSMTVKSTYFVLVIRYEMQYDANHAFGDNLRRHYDVPVSVRIVDIAK